MTILAFSGTFVSVLLLGSAVAAIVNHIVAYRDRQERIQRRLDAMHRESRREDEWLA